MNLFEISYKSEGEHRKIRVVASSGVFAINEVLKRKYGRKNEFVSMADQGVVYVAEPHRTVREALLSRTIQVGALMDAIDDEIANIEIDLERHTKAMNRIAVLKERLATKDAKPYPSTGRGRPV